MTNKEEKKLNIYQRLIEIMKEVRYIEKEKKTVNGQYRFVSHDSVTSATAEAFIKHGVYAKPRIIKNDISTITVSRWDKYAKANKEETNFVCNVEVEYDFINIDDPEDRVSGINGLGQGIDNQDKACGKAISYACKYALLKALGIETGDDPEKDTDFSIQNSDKKKLANIADNDMKETLLEENKKLTQRLVAKIKSFGSVSELEGWLEDKAVKSAYNKLAKYYTDGMAEVAKAESDFRNEYSEQ